MPHVLRYDPEKVPPVLRTYLAQKGWLEYDEEKAPSEQPPYSLWWKSARFTLSQLNSAKYPRQRLNHFAKSSEITKKDTLLRNLKRMKGVHGQVCDVLPPSYILPGEYVKFCQAFADAREEGGSTTWICKPSELSRGRKIFVFQDIGQLSYDCPSVVQSYVDRPLLLSGYKFDLRVYVLVTSFKPLRVHIYRNFLVRFGTEKYDISDLTNVCSHLTNTSLNRFAPGCHSEKEGIGEGCKWDAPRFLSWLEQRGYCMKVLWARIETVVNMTLLSICGSVPSLAACFELYGFDLLIDDQWKPWLLEVNFSPALHVDGPVDERVKVPLVRDMIETLNIPEPVEEAPVVATTSPKATARKRRQRVSRIVTAAKDMQAEVQDSPRGDFELCFPFSPECAEHAKTLAQSSNDKDSSMRSIVGEIKKREIQALHKSKLLIRKMKLREQANAPEGDAEVQEETADAAYAAGKPLQPRSKSVTVLAQTATVHPPAASQPRRSSAGVNPRGRVGATARLNAFLPSVGRRSRK